MLMITSLGATSARRAGLLSRRCVSTLSSNPHIKVFPNAATNGSHLLTYLDTNPPSPRLAIGSTTALPPTPQSFSENHEFLSILTEVLSKHAARDPNLQAQAQAFVAPGSGGAFFPPRWRSRGSRGSGGHVHLSDLRNPPDFGRIAWPEDILGSIEVDGQGTIVGEFQPSGTYRIVTNEGILGLSDYMRTELIERLRDEEEKKEGK